MTLANTRSPQLARFVPGDARCSQVVLTAFLLSCFLRRKNNSVISAPTTTPTKNTNPASTASIAKRIIGPNGPKSKKIARGYTTQS